MQTVIFGRPGCPYCVRAKDLAEKLSNERDDFQYHHAFRQFTDRAHTLPSAK